MSFIERPAPSDEIAPLLAVLRLDPFRATNVLRKSSELAALDRPALAAELCMHIADTLTGRDQWVVLHATGTYALQSRRWRLARQSAAAIMNAPDKLNDSDSHLPAALAQGFRLHADHATAAMLLSFAASLQPHTTTRAELHLEAAAAHTAAKAYELAVAAALRATSSTPAISLRAYEVAITAALSLNDLTWADEIWQRWPAALASTRRLWVGVVIADRRSDRTSAMALMASMLRAASTEGLDLELSELILARTGADLGASTAAMLLAAIPNEPPAARRIVAAAMQREQRFAESLVLINNDESIPATALRIAALAALNDIAALRDVLRAIDAEHHPSALLRAKLVVHAAPAAHLLVDEFATALTAAINACDTDLVVFIANNLTSALSITEPPTRSTAPSIAPLLLMASEYVVVRHGSQHLTTLLPWFLSAAATAPNLALNTHSKDAERFAHVHSALMSSHLTWWAELATLQVLAYRDTATAGLRALELAERALAANSAAAADIAAAAAAWLDEPHAQRAEQLHRQALAALTYIMV
jgi:hypothetical protein